MLIRPELIVYLWMLPVFLFFFIPLVCFPLILIREKLFAAKAQMAGEMESVQQLQGFITDDDQRGFPREKVDGIIAQVSDGIRCCSGTITDFTRFGVCLVTPRGKLDQNAAKLGVLLTGAGESFHMQVRPRWNKDNGSDFSIGASIEETLGRWDPLAGRSGSSQFVNAV